MNTFAMISGLKSVLSEEAVIRPNEPMARHTTLRVGGPADCWVEPARLSDLSALLGICRETRAALTLIGRGSNMLVRDGGLRGLVVSLNHRSFSMLEIHGETIIAGAGVKLRQLVYAARDAEIAGLEFLEGIPGSLGGALRMNAGAMGRSLFDVVESVCYMDADGKVFEVSRENIVVGYRSCPLFKHGNIALSARLSGQRGDAEKIRETLRAYEQKRWSSQPAAPSAGCIFKNPSPDLPAGKLIDQLGLKGHRIGGARVSEKHANFIVTENGATASDVLDLIQVIRERAMNERGVSLETEVEIRGE